MNITNVITQPRALKLYSSGEVADMLGLHRDKVLSVKRVGAPQPSLKVSGRNLYTVDDIAALCDWFESKGTTITRPTFDTTPITAHSTT